MILSNSSCKSLVSPRTKRLVKPKPKPAQAEPSKSTQKSSKLPGKIIKLLVHNSLKIHKKLKKISQKHEKSKKEAKTRIKHEVQALNQVAREENLKNFKFKVFKPKYPWGVDEKRLEKSSDRKKEVDYSEKIYQKPVKRLKIMKNPTFSSSPDLTPQKKSHTSRPEIKTYLKQQRITRKRSKEHEENLKIEKENRRILQLKYIDIISRQIMDKKKKKSGKAGKKILKKCQPIRWVQKSIEDLSKSCLDKAETIQKQKACRNCEGKVSSPKQIIKIPTPEVPLAQSKSPILAQLDAIRQKKMQKQEELKGRFDLIKHKISRLGESKEKAAVKIQAAARGWLCRRFLKTFKRKKVAFDDSNSWLYKKQYPSSPDSFNEEDEEVKKILGVFHMNPSDQPQKKLKFNEEAKALVEFSPIFKEDNFSFSDMNKSLSDCSQKPKPEVKKPLLKDQGHKIKSPACDIFEQKNQKLKEKVLNLFTEMLQDPFFPVPQIDSATLSDYKRLLKDFLDSQDKAMIQSIYSSLESILLSQDLKDFSYFVKQIPTLDSLFSQFCSSRLARASPTPEPAGTPHPRLSLPYPCNSPVSLCASPVQGTFIDLIFSAALIQLEQVVIEDCLVEFFICKINDIGEKLLAGLVSSQAVLALKEFKDCINDDTLMDFTDLVFRRFGEEIAGQMASDRRNDPLDVLSCMQESEIGAGVFEFGFDEVVKTESFLALVAQDYLQVCVFKKMIFDCINEVLVLNSFKSPMPWSLQVVPRPAAGKPSKLYCKVLSTLLKWSSSKLGKIFSSFKNMAMSEEALTKYRESRIVSLLKTEAEDSEFLWTVYEFEETQLKLDISDMILESLVDEILALVHNPN